MKILGRDASAAEAALEEASEKLGKAAKKAEGSADGSSDGSAETPVDVIETHDLKKTVGKSKAPKPAKTPAPKKPKIIMSKKSASP